MDQQEWERINEIVDTALELSKEERTTYIKEKCEGNEELRHKVAELLTSIEQCDTEDFLEGTKAFPSHLAADFSKELENQDSSLIGQTIGHYNIIELIGHGGMGSVFLAERADDAYNKQVAFKILRRGMDTPSNVARFKRERNILASLDHPNIARLYDGGVTQDGLPYLIMEHVKGTPLLEYCNHHRLSVEDRLELFKSVCQAVQHAHRNAIIHRDLKPSNIYVTDDGTVKVLDFGIAKLLESENPDQTLFQTQTGARMLTLGYAAPEQITNETITTATDSYTLGILLYELLAGLHPFNMDDKDLSNIEKLICTETPTRPSSKVGSLPEKEQKAIAERRGITPSDLRQTLKADLNAIIMKALRKEPPARYRSVEQMLEDLDRYEESRPLIAQSDTLQYRVGKFIRRNRNPVIGVLFTLLAILGFASYHVEQITEERNIAKKEAKKAQTVKSFLVDIFRSSNPQSPSFDGKNITAEQLLVNGKKKIGENLKTQPDVYTEVLTAIGDALTGIDAFEEAKKSYQRIITISSQTSASLENKIRALVKIGNLESKRRSNDQASLVPALKAHKLLNQMKAPPTDLKASVFSLLGKTNVFSENYEQANTYYEKADSIYNRAKMESSFDYIQMLSGYGKSLIYTSAFKKAEQVLLRSNKLHREEYSQPTTTIAENYRKLGWVNRDLGNFKKSNDYFLKSIELYRSLTGKESLSTALSMYHLSINYFLSADFKKAEKLAKDVLHIYQKRVEPTNDYRRVAKQYIAIAKYNQNELSEAKSLLQEIIKKRKRYMGENDFNLAGPLSHLAMVYHKEGQSQKAISTLKRSIRLYKKELGEYNRRVARAKIKLAAIYREIDMYKLARKYFQQVQSIHQKVVPEKNHQQANYYFEYGKLHRDLDNPQQAQKYFRKAYSIYHENFGEDSKQTKKAKSLMQQSQKRISS